MIQIIHGVVPIPSSKDHHRVLNDNSAMPKSVQGSAVPTADDLLPFEPFINAALVQVSKSRNAIITTIYVKGTSIEYDAVICSALRSRSNRLHHLPPLPVQVIPEEIIEVFPTLLRVAAKEVKRVLEC